MKLTRLDFLRGTTGEIGEIVTEKLTLLDEAYLDVFALRDSSQDKSIDSAFTRPSKPVQ